jgi:hypothetical protein
MSEWEVEQAFRESLTTIGLPADKVAMPNREFKPPADASLWYAVSFLPAARDPLTLGEGGEDEYVGLMQVDVSVPQGSGMKAAMEAAVEFTALYVAGTDVEYNGQVAKVRKSEISQPRQDGVRLVVSVSVYWSARIPRN